ncbi:hypothetical protein GCM10011490_19020 [Pseudoclavibacter endophyticus]|uniref:nuclear transport factor 2 family protein n=1 Tax=Pseudoclavibacter endophyticus TaxID=1778590 RepID=UPI00166A8E60|nr:nuclear transport factor 2 family protein [Pseudoclavibacter endophyticus]GGA68717.1 hypothetical protein GCM10011490_19020 [Pseudoclavibacter endophyticus]
MTEERALRLDALLAENACTKLVIEFCNLMDQGRVADAVELHTDEAAMVDAVSGKPMVGKTAMRDRLERVRFSYEGRVTLHTPTNILVTATGADRATGSFVAALYDLVEVEGGRGIGTRATELLGFASEDVEFERGADGVWRFSHRVVRFLAGAKRLPIGQLPADLPFGKIQ